jgi:hypothetical protein
MSAMNLSGLARIDLGQFSSGFSFGKSIGRSG